MVTNAQTIVSGCTSSSSYFLCSSGFPMGWGDNVSGQLGNGTVSMSTTSAVQTSELSDIIAISAGDSHSLFLKNDGSVWACGYNGNGRLGDGTFNSRSTPVQVSEQLGVTAIAAGGGHSLLLKNNGSVWSCGWNNSGQLGDGTVVGSNTAVQVSGLSGIIAIAAGNAHSLFLKDDGTVWACGDNGGGQLGDETNTDRQTPVLVVGLSGIIAIAAGESHSLFLKNDGTVWGCGVNASGQLGDETEAMRNTPVQVAGLSGITAVVGGYSHSLFLKDDGSVWACGGNTKGQLGDGTTSWVNNTATQVSGLSDIIAIAAGDRHSLFQKDDGSIWACGANNGGQLGDGTITDRLTPVQVLIDTDCLGVGIEEAGNHFSSLSVYPNPANSTIVIAFKVHNSKCTVKIYNAVGQEVLQSSSETYWNNHQSSIDISSLSPGVYFIRLFDGENQGLRKFVKE